MSLDQIYDSLLTEPDPVTGKWPMISSCYPITLITLGYLYFIYIAGPRFMKNRPPYKLKNFIFYYNLFQIIANVWIVKKHIHGGWLTKYGFKCPEPDFDSPNAQMLINVLWWVAQLKLFDYIETCVFVLRKKQTQVTVLHVYHHISIATFLWIGMRYVPDMRVTFLSLLNCSVHVMMYTYYLCAAWNPRIQRIVAPIKPYITIIQMVQFIGMLAYLTQALFPYCELPKGIKILPFFSINLTIYFVLFYNFYRKTYVKTTKQKT